MFVCQARAELVGRTVRFWPGAPDLAVEVVSPGDSSSDVQSKAVNWIAAGTTALLVLDPARRSATVYRTGGDVHVYTDGDFDLSDVVPGWRVAVADFFV